MAIEMSRKNAPQRLFRSIGVDYMKLSADGYFGLLFPILNVVEKAS